MLIVLERECLDLSEAIEQLEREARIVGHSDGEQEADRFQEQIFQESKELEEQKSKEASELLGRKHKLGNLEKERDRARMLQGTEPSGAEGGFTGDIDSSSFCSCSPSLAREADEAMSASSWTSPARWRERDWWSADLEGGFSGPEGGSMDPKGKVDHW